MKTIKEKAKAYDEAVKRAKAMAQVAANQDEAIGFVNTIFPELKVESEDERIRKALIKFHKSTMDIDGIKGENIVAWLEKQGEQALPFINERAWLYLVADVLTWKDGIGQYLDDPRVQALAKKLSSEYAQKLYGIEMQSEKPEGKSALEAIREEKVDNQNWVAESKFRVGKWIVNNASKDVFLIKSVNNGLCTLEDIKGNIIFPCLPPCESESHLWTIQDAKDGDVLIDKSHAGECVFIFKEARQSDIKTNINNPLAIIGYCGINHIGFTSQLSGLGFGDTVNCTYYPAAKGQRDILFQKMKETGYEWDAEKKELKKMELTEHESEEELSDFEAALFSAFSDGWQQYLNGEEVDFAQWAREHSAELLEAANQNHIAWSEEDEKILNDAINAVAVTYYYTYNKKQKITNWLKSIKPQKQWKPNDEQLDVLHDVVIYVKNSMFPDPTNVLKDLYDQLKKLKRE